MKALESYRGDPWEVFKSVREAKEQPDVRACLIEISSAIQARYADYEAHKSRLEALPRANPAFTPDQSEALNHCYNSPSGPLKRLKATILHLQSGNTRSKCQYCGIDSPRTFDHYVPRSKGFFPEFVIHPNNILPCCHACNTQGGTNWLEEGERTQIHLYTDAIEVDERFLVARIEFDNDEKPAARFDIDTKGRRNAEFGRRYERHCRTLDLFQRFAEAAHGELDKVRAEIRAMDHDESFETVRVAVLRQAGELATSLGANNWEVALRFAVAESQRFITSCLSSSQESVR